MKTEKFISKNSLKSPSKMVIKMIGTMDWFNSLMDKSEFVIRPRPDGLPALYLKIVHEKEEECKLCALKSTVSEMMLE